MGHAITAIRVVFFAVFVFLLVKGKTMLWFALFTASLVAALIFGRVYCGYVCPINTLMIPTDWLAKAFSIQTDTKPKWLVNGYFPWVLLILSIGLMIFSRLVLKVNLPILPILTDLGVVTLRFRPAVFHNLICPFGALQRLFSKYTRYSEKVHTDKCIGCKLCKEVCPSNALLINNEKKAIITHDLCHQCTSCQ